jgi:hypothetical protein
MKQVALIVAVAGLVFSTPGAAYAKDRAQATAGQPQHSMSAKPRRTIALKRGDERTSVVPVPSANRDYCPGQY